MEISNDLEQILRWIAISLAVMIVTSIISFVSMSLKKKDLTDQTGWQNFAKPFIGISVFTIMFLFVILIVFVLLGVV
ncbi:hypothetical protein GF389_05810 [Candidatus Dojkabacteria bacterium]|nr:hypothetical protein [Candidatus Dojkabacteria bacterium]